jgi:DNA-binding MarR family transcriptional regulator
MAVMLSPMSTSPPTTREASLPRVLVRLMFGLAGAYAEASREQGLTAQQARLLCAAGREPTAGLGDLAGLLHCDRSNVSRLVERAEERGLVARKGTDTDGRVTVVALSQDGQQVVDRFTETLGCRLMALVDDWPEEDRLAAAALLGRLTESLNAVPEFAPSERFGEHLLPPS